MKKEIKMKKIAFIIQHLTNGGAERVISNLTLDMQKKYDISLIVYDGNSVTYPYGGKLIDLKLPPVKGFFGKVFNLFKRMKKVKEIRKVEHFDCVVSFMFNANVINVLTRCGEKTIISARNFLSAEGLTRWDIFRERFIAKRADIEVALSKMVEYDLINNFGISRDKLTTIYNPCDSLRIAELSKEACEYEFDPNTFYFVNAGRMVEQKGQWHLLKAFAKFHREVPKSRLLILGEGEMRQKLEQLARELNITDYVDFLGFVENPYKYMAHANCFVLSSLFEGLGNVIIEAMACDIPVISYDCLAGPREMLAPECNANKRAKEIEWCSCGVLVPAADDKVSFSTEFDLHDENLYLAMLQLYENKELAEKVVLNAKKRIQEFLPSQITQQWEQIFD